VDQRRQVTREGLEDIKAELADLINVKRPHIITVVAEARSHGDLRENSAYDAARHDQMMLERRILEIEDLIRNAEVVETNVNSNIVGLGTTVVVVFDGAEETFTVVGAAEARPALNRISVESPIGRALMGKRAGETAVASTPRGRSSILIKEIVK
jgi:transcription elongation factor GreA